MQGAQRQYPHCRKKSMRKMNKVAAAVLAVAMVGSMAVPAFAVTGNDTAGDYTGATGESTKKERQTTVTYTIGSSYEWTIHDSVDLTNETNHKKVDQQVKVVHSVIPEDKKLQITVAGQGDNKEFEIKSESNTGSTVRTYTVESDQGTTTKTKINPNDTKTPVLEVGAGVDTKIAKVDFKLDNQTTASEIASTYVGNVTYTADIVDAD